MLERFVSDVYYTAGHDPGIDLPYVKLHQNGLQLIADYYAKKYHTEIFFHRNVYDFSANIVAFVETVRLNKNPDYRVAMLIGTPSSHVIPVIYIRKNSKEIFLCADSLGVNHVFSTRMNQLIKSNLKKISGTEIYTVPTLRQIDYYSCGADALVFARDCTSRNAAGEYVISDLLQNLEARLEKKSGYSEVKLPDELLRTAQHKYFFDCNKEESKRIVHICKNTPETINDFSTRYTLNRENKSPQRSYLRIKGEKLADLIEVLFYEKQLVTQLGEAWSNEWRSQYFLTAKSILKNQGSLLYNRSRLGLHGFANNFLSVAMIAIENKTALVIPRGSLAIQYQSPENFEIMASTLLWIIADNKYWSRKKFFGTSIPGEIALMQNVLKAVKNTISVGEKIQLLRKTIREEILQKGEGILRLLGLRHTTQRDSVIEDFCQFFMADWTVSPLYKRIVDAWLNYNQKIEHSLPNSTPRQRINIR